MNLKALKIQIAKFEAKILDVCKESNCDFTDPQYKYLTQQLQELKNKKSYQEIREIQAYCNSRGYTDVEPYEIVKVVSGKCVEVRAMKSVLVKAPQDFHAGGFCGHFSDNNSQEWAITSDPEAKTERVRWSEANRQWQQGKYGRFSMSETPVKHYDYNF